MSDDSSITRDASVHSEPATTTSDAEATSHAAAAAAPETPALLTKEELMSLYDSTPVAERNNFSKALPTAQKAALLAALKERLEQGNQPPKPQFPPTKMGYAYVSSGRGGSGDGEEDFDDYEEDVDLEYEDTAFDELLQHYENHVTKAAFSGGGGIDLATLLSPEGGKVLATDLTARRKEIGDFELLRLAKMGDSISFKEFEGLLQTSVNMFFDNNQRDALHYAVDGGSTDLVKYLVEDKKMNLRKDEKMKATALDMAVLLGRDEIVKYLTSRFPADPKELDDALKAFAPAPPRFCISKAAPTVQPPSRERQFWSNDIVTKAATPEFSFSATPLSIAPREDDRDVFIAVANRPTCGSHHGLDAWTIPVDPAILDGFLVTAPSSELDVSAPTLAVGVVARNTATNVLTPAGVCFAVGGHVEGADSAPLQITIRQGASTATPAPCVLVGAFSVAPNHQGHGANALMMQHLKKSSTSPDNVALFRCKERLPLQPVTLIKWFRRSLKPLNMLSSNYLLAATEVYPDFFSYDDRLRVDWVAKESLLPGQSMTATLKSWVFVNEITESVAAIVSAISNLVNKAGEQSAVAFHCTSPSAMGQTLLNPGLKTYAIAQGEDANLVVTDIVCIRIRESREADADGKRLRCATVVFAVFTTITGEKKALEVLAMAAQLGCDTLFIPNTCGFSDSDFSKAMFDESDNCREYLYAVREEGKNGLTSAISGTTMLPAGKVSVPLGLI